jgi:polysaccharide pyruvyl transferase csaB
MHKKIVIHQLSLVGIGGVQQSFVPYFKMALQKSEFDHQIYGTYPLDDYFKEIGCYYKNISSSVFNKLKFIYFLYSKDYIVHFYNNIGSHSLHRILNSLPLSNIILHERGVAWNLKDEDIRVYRDNANKANLLLANSNASKTMMIERFGVDASKIHVLYNGFLSGDMILNNNAFATNDSNKFKVGYIGRLDTPKGVHTFIEVAKKLPQYEFFIAGNGPWELLLKEMAGKRDNIFFVGRVKNPLDFINSMDLIIVPSIREPLGNTIIEAGFCKKPVIASCIDGISEIIDNGISGVLIEPKKEISIRQIPINSVPMPEYVVNPKTKKLQQPKEIESDELANHIINLEQDYALRQKYGNALYDSVVDKFNIKKYFSELEKIYKNINS